jgi:hypothetical protein
VKYQIFLAKFKSHRLVLVLFKGPGDNYQLQKIDFEELCVPLQVIKEIIFI